MQILQQNDPFQVRFWDHKIITLFLPSATHSPSLWLDNSLPAKESRERSLKWNLICCQNYPKNRRKLYTDRSNCSVRVHNVQNSNTETVPDSGTHPSHIQPSLTAPQVSWCQTTNTLLSCMKTVFFFYWISPVFLHERECVRLQCIFSWYSYWQELFPQSQNTLYKFMGPDKELKILHERGNGAVEIKEFLES